MSNKGCYIYTRVSTAIQVDGYSLDAQRQRVRDYAKFQGFDVIREFSDEGKSGKNIDGRPAFTEMINLIKANVDNIAYVLVFKLSRFGRNAADVLNTLQTMQDYGVNLICVEDGIDSSKDSGKLVISVLSAVAEIERDNILVQTMAGRRQKAKEGKWNGGFAPYGYKLVDGKLEMAEDEAEVIKLIYDLYLHTTKGAPAIAAELNKRGITKKVRQNGTMSTFTSSFITKVIDNPVYSGMLAYGRRKTEKIQGERNKYHIVPTKDYMLNEGIHEGLVTIDEWNQCQAKRKKIGRSHEKLYSLEHEHLLSGIVKCPVCGMPLYGNVARKKNADGTIKTESFYYACKHRFFQNGRRCDYHKQWNEELLDGAIGELIKGIVANDEMKKKFTDFIKSKCNYDDMQKEIHDISVKINKLESSKDRLANQMDSLDLLLPNANKRYDDMQKRLDKIYDEITTFESELEETKKRQADIDKQKVNANTALMYLKSVGKVYDKLSDADKKKVIKSLIEEIHIYPERQKDGRIIKDIKFTFPFGFDSTGKDDHSSISWDKKNLVETIVLLCLKK